MKDWVLFVRLIGGVGYTFRNLTHNQAEDHRGRLQISGVYCIELVDNDRTTLVSLFNSAIASIEVYQEIQKPDKRSTT